MLSSATQQPLAQRGGAAANASTEPRASHVRVGSFADLFAAGGLLVLAAALMIVTWGSWGDFGGDTGYDLLAGARLAGGELPYRDYVYYYGPLAPALLALCFSLGGTGLGSAVSLGLAVAVGTILLTYAIARVLLDPLGAFLAAAMTAPIVLSSTPFSFVLPHAYSAPLGIVVALGFLLCLARYATGNTPRSLTAAGAFAGLATLTRPEITMAIFAAAGLWLVLRAWSGAGGWREALRFTAPVLVIPAVVYGVALTVVSPYRLLWENLYPMEALRAAGNAILKIHAPMTVASAVELVGNVLLYGAGTLGLLLLARVLARGGSLGRLTLVATVVIGSLVVVAALARLETMRYGLTFVYGWIPAGSALAALVGLVRFSRRSGDWNPAAQLQLASTVVLAVLAAKTYAAFFIYSTVPQYAVYTIPFVAIFLAHLHLVELARGGGARAVGAAWLAFMIVVGLGLTWKDARAESATVHGPGGTMAVRPRDGTVYQAALSSIMDRTQPGDPILLAPQLTTLYVLTGRVNPLPQLSLLPGALPTEFDERAAIARLESRGVRFVVVDRRSFGEYGHSTFGGSFQRVLASWIRENFDHTTSLGDGSAGSPELQVWVKRAP
jgi:hypothetical protein